VIQSPVLKREKKNQFLNYQRNQIMSMNPLQLLIKVYDVAILSCKKRDMEKASKAIVELISALNFDYEEISLGLFRLYQYCLDRIKQGEFEESIRILEGLRESWTQVRQK